MIGLLKIQSHTFKKNPSLSVDKLSLAKAKAIIMIGEIALINTLTGARWRIGCTNIIEVINKKLNSQFERVCMMNLSSFMWNKCFKYKNCAWFLFEIQKSARNKCWNRYSIIFNTMFLDSTDTLRKIIYTLFLKLLQLLKGISMFFSIQVVQMRN